jgi:glyoxylase-like metal-dependent hydrolase (beta-lactamase superfamily II)
VPCLEQIGYRLSEIKFLVLTHKHGDHAGGMKRILNIAHDVKVVTDVCGLFREVSTYPLAGHTDDSIGVFDRRTGTLISGDGLQGAGVDKYRCSAPFTEKYLETIERIKGDDRIEHILFSHAYEPWYKDRIDGREAVIAAVEKCKEYV